jgi:hypothetical protein
MLILCSSFSNQTVNFGAKNRDNYIHSRKFQWKSCNFELKKVNLFRQCSQAKMNIDVNVVCFIDNQGTEYPLIASEDIHYEVGSGKEMFKRDENIRIKEKNKKQKKVVENLEQVNMMYKDEIRDENIIDIPRLQEDKIKGIFDTYDRILINDQFHEFNNNITLIREMIDKIDEVVKNTTQTHRVLIDKLVVENTKNVNNMSDQGKRKWQSNHIEDYMKVNKITDDQNLILCKKWFTTSNNFKTYLLDLERYVEKEKVYRLTHPLRTDENLNLFAIIDGVSCPIQSLFTDGLKMFLGAAYEGFCVFVQDEKVLEMLNQYELAYLYGYLLTYQNFAIFKGFIKTILQHIKDPNEHVKYNLQFILTHTGFNCFINCSPLGLVEGKFMLMSDDEKLRPNIDFDCRSEYQTLDNIARSSDDIILRTIFNSTAFLEDPIHFFVAIFMEYCFDIDIPHISDQWATNYLKEFFLVNRNQNHWFGVSVIGDRILQIDEAEHYNDMTTLQSSILGVTRYVDLVNVNRYDNNCMMTGTSFIFGCFIYKAKIAQMQSDVELQKILSDVRWEGGCFLFEVLYDFCTFLICEKNGKQFPDNLTLREKMIIISGLRDFFHGKTGNFKFDVSYDMFCEVSKTYTKDPYNTDYLCRLLFGFVMELSDRFDGKFEQNTEKYQQLIQNILRFYESRKQKINETLIDMRRRMPRQYSEYKYYNVNGISETLAKLQNFFVESNSSFFKGVKLFIIFFIMGFANIFFPDLNIIQSLGIFLCCIVLWIISEHLSIIPNMMLLIFIIAVCGVLYYEHIHIPKPYKKIEKPKPKKNRKTKKDRKS